ncbi:hypothetical protein PVAP13_9NG257973 [Panicum virgatum]|uniref:Uncharacterized protein n=1 Tax=Panicum virgatum TaxID=38727 RepID=A0A8T0MMF6_PANVG|nr:hypothetical protein PVAP13_9NG257973 [Panicum virgatum]
MCRKLIAKVVWVMSSFIVCIAMAMVTILSSCRSRWRGAHPARRQACGMQDALGVCSVPVRGWTGGGSLLRIQA